MKSEEAIRGRIEQLKGNKFYKWGGRHSGYSKSLKREIQAAIDELEWVLEEKKNGTENSWRLPGKGQGRHEEI